MRYNLCQMLRGRIEMLMKKQPKMVYASSKDALKRSLNGLAAEFQANDEDDIEYASVLNRVSKGLA